MSTLIEPWSRFVTTGIDSVVYFKKFLLDFPDALALDPNLILSYLRVCGASREDECA